MNEFSSLKSEISTLMASRSKGDPWSPELQQRVLASLDSSHLSSKAFSKAVGLPPHTIGNWRNKIKKKERVSRRMKAEKKTTTAIQTLRIEKPSSTYICLRFGKFLFEYN